MGFCLGFARCLAILINILFSIFGLAILVLGILIRTNSNDILNKIFSSLILPSGQNIGTVAFLNPVANLAIGIGSVILILSLAGFIGLCGNFKVLLILYTLIVSLLIIAEIVTTAMFFTGQFDSMIKNALNQTIVNNYVSDNSSDIYSLAWTAFMNQFQCCGVNDYQDFYASINWQHGIFATPLACCKNATTNVQATNFQCAINPTDLTSNWKTGCWQAGLNFLSQYRGYAIGALVGLMLLELILVIVVVAYIGQLNKDDY